MASDEADIRAAYNFARAHSTLERPVFLPAMYWQLFEERGFDMSTLRREEPIPLPPEPGA